MQNIRLKTLSLVAAALAVISVCVNMKAQIYQYNDLPPGGAGNNTPISTGTLTNFSGTNGAAGTYSGTNVFATNIVLAPHTATNYFTLLAIHQGMQNPGGVLGGTGVSLYPCVYALSNGTGSLVWSADLNIDGKTGSIYTRTEPYTYTLSMAASDLNANVYTNTNTLNGYWNLPASNIWNSDWIELSVTNNSSNSVALVAGRWSYNTPQ